MSVTIRRLPAVVIALVTLIPLQAAMVSREGADAFDGKIAQIQRQGAGLNPVSTLRTEVTEDELNSWFMYRSQSFLSEGLTQPQITLVGDGGLIAQAIIDLDVAAQQRSSGGGFDPLSLISGKVPVTVTGVLQSGDGVARLDVQTVLVSGFPMPVAVLEELARYYSRTPELPLGVRLNDAFDMPAGIRRVDIGPGQAVVVQ
jgi:hypothetical protein